MEREGNDRGGKVRGGRTEGGRGGEEGHRKIKYVNWRKGNK